MTIRVCLSPHGSGAGEVFRRATAPRRRKGAEQPHRNKLSTIIPKHLSSVEREVQVFIVLCKREAPLCVCGEYIRSIGRSPRGFSSSIERGPVNVREQPIAVSPLSFRRRRPVGREIVQPPVIPKGQQTVERGGLVLEQRERSHGRRLDVELVADPPKRAVTQQAHVLCRHLSAGSRNTGMTHVRIRSPKGQLFPLLHLVGHYTGFPSGCIGSPVRNREAMYLSFSSNWRM